MKSGLLLLDKQPGLTSFDCLRALKRQLKRTDLGHGGTLDKFASGLLPVLVGEGLKLVRFFLEEHPGLPTYWKHYEGVFELGTSTETGDPEGAVVERRSAVAVTFARVNAAMATFVGAEARYEQTPPRYSAKKIGGERASDLARAGHIPELKPVPVTLRLFHCLGIEPGPDAGLRVRFEVECSKGTYVRALAEDLARKLDTVAHVSELKRTAVGDFRLADAHRLDELERAAAQPGGADALILDLAQATAFLPRFELIGGEREQLKVGKVDGLVTRLANSGLPASPYCAVDSEGTPRALLELTAEKRGLFLRAFS